MRSGVRNVASVFSLTLLFASAALGATWEATVTASSPPSFPGPRPMHAKYGFGWSGFPGANADVRLTKPSGDRFQLDGTIHTIGLVRALWKFDGTHTSRVDASTLRPLEMKQIENVRNKKIVTNLSFDSSGVTSKETETPGNERGSENPALRLSQSLRFVFGVTLPEKPAAPGSQRSTNCRLSGHVRLSGHGHCAWP